MSLILHGERLFKNLPHLNKNNAYLNWSQNTYVYNLILKTLPEGQRQLISLVLLKLLLSSRAIAALGTHK